MIRHSKEDCERIEEATRKQSKCARWFEERYGRITSTFGTICKGGVTTSKVKAIVSSGRPENGKKQTAAAIQWGQTHEDIAYDYYRSMLLPHENQVRKAEIFIADCGFLATSPDGVVSNAVGDVCGAIEIKCPYSCRDMTVRDGCSKLSLSFASWMKTIT